MWNESNHEKQTPCFLFAPCNQQISFILINVDPTYVKRAMIYLLGRKHHMHIKAAKK